MPKPRFQHCLIILHQVVVNHALVAAGMILEDLPVVLQVVVGMHPMEEEGTIQAVVEDSPWVVVEVHHLLEQHLVEEVETYFQYFHPYSCWVVEVHASY